MSLDSLLPVVCVVALFSPTAAAAHGIAVVSPQGAEPLPEISQCVSYGVESRASPSRRGGLFEAFDSFYFHLNGLKLFFVGGDRCCRGGRGVNGVDTV